MSEATLQKICLIEDDHAVRRATKTTLERANYQVTGEANTLGGAFSLLDSISDGETACDLIITDANLGNTKSGEDLRAIYEEYRRQEIRAKFLVYSGREIVEKLGIEVDGEVIKGGPPSELLPAIKQIFV